VYGQPGKSDMRGLHALHSISTNGIILNSYLHWIYLFKTTNKGCIIWGRKNKTKCMSSDVLEVAGAGNSIFVHSTHK
jgi:hypothetical protein